MHDSSVYRVHSRGAIDDSYGLGRLGLALAVAAHVMPEKLMDVSLDGPRTPL